MKMPARVWKTVTSSMVGKNLYDFGKVLARDVGKRYYVENRMVYIENDEQLAKRKRQQNPQRAALPIGKKIKVNYIIVKRDGTVQASVPVKRNPAKRKKHVGRYDSSSHSSGLAVDKKAMALWPCGHAHRSLSAYQSCVSKKK